MLHAEILSHDADILCMQVRKVQRCSVGVKRYPYLVAYLITFIFARS